MKVIALNIRHGGGNRIKSIVPILVQSKADIIVLTEFRFHNNSNIVRNLLKKEGYAHTTYSSKDPKTNYIKDCINTLIKIDGVSNDFASLDDLKL